MQFKCNSFAIQQKIVYNTCRKFLLGRRQAGKARDSDSRIRRFESCRPSHYDL